MFSWRNSAEEKREKRIELLLNLLAGVSFVTAVITAVLLFTS